MYISISIRFVLTPSPFLQVSLDVVIPMSMATISSF